MRRLFLTVAIIFSGYLHADAVSECKKAAESSVKACTKKGSETASQQNAAAVAVASQCAGVTDCAGDSSTLGKQNNAGLTTANKFCDDQASECTDKCSPSKGQKPEEKKFLSQQRDDCKKKIDEVKSQLQGGQPGNTDAKNGGQKTADASKSSQSSMPPIPPLPPPAEKKTDPTTPPATADKSTPPATTPPPAPQAPTQTADGKADFKTASKPSASAVAQACAGRNASEISGGCTEQTTQVASVSPFPSNNNSAAGGGGSGGGGGGGGKISAASVAGLAAGLNKGESEKDGKNTGLKAASMNVGVDGGGGGGGGAGSSGGNALGDLDFGFKPNALRNPASTAIKKSADMAVPGQPSVAQERFSVVRIVTDVYSDKCKAGKFLHCGNNK